jgi:hypothetical protein
MGRQTKDITGWRRAVTFPFVLFFLALWFLALLPGFLLRLCLHLLIWCCWCSRGLDILFVYSDSPVWRSHIEAEILPHLGERAVILNWSSRKQWRFSLARLAFSHFAGDREFNPIALVFRPFRRVRTFRFWRPFRDFKHGKPEPLRRLESEFFAVTGIQVR